MQNWGTTIFFACFEWSVDWFVLTRILALFLSVLFNIGKDHNQPDMLSDIGMQMIIHQP